MAITNNLPKLLEDKFGGRPNLMQVQEDTGLAYGTVNAWVKNRINRVDFPVLEAWCKYLGKQPGDILVYEAE